MINFRKSAVISLTVILVLFLSAFSTSAQQARGSLRGVVSDELGAAIVGANVVLTDSGGTEKASTTTNMEGVYTFSGIEAGKYLIHATAPGFAASDEAEIDVAGTQRQTKDLTLRVTIEEKVTVAADTPLSTEATNNANQTVITGRDLDALPDDPDELAAALQALAGPSVGPNGGQIFIDGFSGGRLPPKESIREIRINQNIYAAENDQPSGRIDILTKPGTDKFRGGSTFSFEDESFNSRNPFSFKRTPFQVRSFGGNLGGPIVKKKASFFVNFERRETDDNELVKVTVLGPNLNPLDLGFGVITPRRNTSFEPRIDYQLNANNTLIARYSYNKNLRQNNGVVGFSLPERAYDQFSTQNTLQLTETAVLNPAMIDETRFQFSHGHNESLGDNTIPTLDVSGSFTSGGSQVGHVVNKNNSWELQNFLAWQRGSHALKFGGRIRGVSISDSNPNNFGGTYRFTGGFVPSLDANNEPLFGAPIFVDSLERYRRNQLFASLGLSSLEIQRRGGGASQFSIAAGNPLATVKQFDAGVYAQDDWRFRPNLTFSFGLRYENQTNIQSPLNFAPRLAFAWSPGAANSTRPPKTVIRGGAGVFYNRFSESQTLQENRFNGVNQQQFSVSESLLYVCQRNQGVDPGTACVAGSNGRLVFIDPALLPPSPLLAFPNLPPTAGLTAARQITWRVADDVQAPVVYLGGVQVERQLPYRFTATVGFYTIHIQHVIRARDINAPLPGTISQATPIGLRPFGDVGEIYQYESSGRFDQNQLFVAVNNRFSRSISIFANYSLSKTQNDTDGQGGALFPPNSYDLTGEYGRAAFDVRQRFTIAGTVNLPWWRLSLNPFITAASGRPFNITTGQDSNFDRLFTERPSFAPANVDCSNPPANIICTPFGNFNRNPGASDTIIPRNYGQGPGYFSVNVRLTKTWSFGRIHSSSATNTSSSGEREQGQRGAGGRGGGGAVGPRGGGIPGISGGGGGPRGGGGGFGLGSGTPETKRYTMQFSLNFSNLLNHVNLSIPNGNLSSPFFGESLALAPSFNGFGGGGGGGGSTGAGNRRITAQIRFNF